MIEAVTSTNLAEFLDYCRVYGPRHDESFVPSGDEALSPDQPSFVLREEGRVVGAASLLRGGSWGRAGRARFAVLHAGGETPGSALQYSELVGACRRSVGANIHQLALFLPDATTSPRDHLQALGFAAERIAFLMVSGTRSAHAGAAGFELFALEAGSARLAEFLAVRNRNFRELQGSHELGLEDIETLFTEPTAWRGGVNLLVDPVGRPCGTMVLERDDEPDALCLATVSVDAPLRGRGLGRFLVRQALSMAWQAGFAKVYLSVNALNAQATRLYASEGFTVVKAMVCLVGPS